MSILTSETAEASDEHRVQMNILLFQQKQEEENLKQERIKTDSLNGN